MGITRHLITPALVVGAVLKGEGGTPARQPPDGHQFRMTVAANTTSHVVFHAQTLRANASLYREL
jgi:hypothetical protein